MGTQGKWKLKDLQFEFRITYMRPIVESYCATATLSSATVPSGQYAKYNGSSSQAICSVDANLATQNGDGWKTIVRKLKKNGSKTLDHQKEHERTDG